MSDQPVVERSGPVVDAPAQALVALLDASDPHLGTQGLSLLWHWLQLLDDPRRDDPGRDGHPVRGVVPAPPAPGLRRMWAGGRVRRTGPLNVGEQAVRRSQVERTEVKDGRTGRFTLVVVRHRLWQGEVVVVDEEQDVFYREPARDAPAPDLDVPSRTEISQDEREVVVDPPLLFRFSALTYNGHRIHDDRDYARDVEGNPGLVTHGPLQVLLMAEAVRERVGRTARSIDYRLVAPLYDHQGLVVGARPSPDGKRWTAWVCDLSGRVTARSQTTTD